MEMMPPPPSGLSATGACVDPGPIFSDGKFGFFFFSDIFLSYITRSREEKGKEFFFRTAGNKKSLSFMCKAPEKVKQDYRI